LHPARKRPAKANAPAPQKVHLVKRISSREQRADGGVNVMLSKSREVYFYTLAVSIQVSVIALVTAMPLFGL
jgi:hypothetical protein